MIKKLSLAIALGLLLLLSACSDNSLNTIPDATSNPAQSADTDIEKHSVNEPSMGAGISADKNVDSNTNSSANASVGVSVNVSVGDDDEFVARDWTTDEFRFRTISDSEVAVIGICSDNSECIVPAEVDGYTVTQFYASVPGHVTRLTIPDSLTGKNTRISEITFILSNKDLIVTYKNEAYAMVEGQVKGTYGMTDKLFAAIED